MDFNERMDDLALDYLAQALPLTPTDNEFVGWVDAQPVAVRAGLYRKGPVTCWAEGLLSFQAWVLTVRGYSLDEFMVHRLTPTDYLRWVERFATTTLARST